MYDPKSAGAEAYMMLAEEMTGISFKPANLAARHLLSPATISKYVIYNTLIPRNIRLAEAPSYGLPINMYDPK